MRNQSIDCVKAIAAILMVYAHLYFVNLDSNFHIGIIYAYSGRYPFTNSGDIRSVRW